MSKSSKRRKQQAKRTALAQVKREIVQNAPSAIPPGVLAQITGQITTTSYSGPVPPPTLLKEYNEIVPGGAERILSMAERQSAHRIDLESTVIKGESRRSWCGLWLGFVVSLAIIGAGLWVALTASPTAGAQSSLARLSHSPASSSMASTHEELSGSTRQDSCPESGISADVPPSGTALLGHSLVATEHCVLTFAIMRAKTTKPAESKHLALDGARTTNITALPAALDRFCHTSDDITADPRPRACRCRPSARAARWDRARDG